MKVDPMRTDGSSKSTAAAPNSGSDLSRKAEAEFLFARLRRRRLWPQTSMLPAVPLHCGWMLFALPPPASGFGNRSLSTPGGVPVCGAVPLNSLAALAIRITAHRFRGWYSTAVEDPHTVAASLFDRSSDCRFSNPAGRADQAGDLETSVACVMHPSRWLLLIAGRPPNVAFYGNR